jgi:hypothetical protein
MKAISALLLLLALLPVSAQAQNQKIETPANNALGQICKMDIEQYCKGINKKRIRDLKECLAKHEKNLFPTCQNYYKDVSRY